MKPTRARIIQLVSLLVVQALALLFFSLITPGLTVHTIWSALGVAIVIALVESFVWWVFIEFFAHLRAILYPSVLPYDGTPVLYASGVYQLLNGWRTTAQTQPPA